MAASSLSGTGRDGWTDALQGRLVGSGEFVGQLPVGGPVALPGQVHLVDGGAVPVEELETAQGGSPRFPLHGKAEVPVVHEQAQVDALVEDQSHPALKMHVAKDTVLLVHGVLVASEGHDRAESFETADELRPLGMQADRPFPAGSRHELCFAHPHLYGGVADPDPGVGASKRVPDLLEIPFGGEGRRGRVRHVKLSFS